jgi:pimeloyl-ACP methyl ester carboxylesterase
VPGRTGRLNGSGTTRHVVSGEATSPDGTTLAFDRVGQGPPVVLVHGAFTDRTHPTLAGVASALAPWFTVFNYDRRGRGGSGDTQPYAVEREIEDLAAVIEVAGGSAMVFGGSSGAGLALEAAARAPAISRLAVWEPPYHVAEGAPALPLDFGQQLARLVAEGRRGEAIERFMVEAAEAPPAAVAAMRAGPEWPALEAIANTLAYEAEIMGPGNVLPSDRLSAITQPTLVLTGDCSPAWMAQAGRAVDAAVPRSSLRVLAGQSHAVAAEALAPELLEFFATGP